MLKQNSHKTIMSAQGSDILWLYLNTWRQHYTCTCSHGYLLQQSTAETDACTYDSIAYWKSVLGSLAVNLRWPRRCITLDNYGLSFMQTYCPGFSGSVQFRLCEYLLNNEAYTTVIDQWKDQLSTIHVDVAVVGQMSNHGIDGHCLHNHIPRRSLSQSNSVSLDVSRMIGMRVRSFNVCIAPSFVDQWDMCDIQCSQCHPGLRNVKVVGIFPRALLRRNPQVTSLECLILSTGDFRSLIRELAPSGTPKSLQQLHFWFFVQRDDYENIVDYGGIATKSLSEWMNGTWATLPACPWLTQVSLHAIHNGGFPTHLLDQNPQVTSVNVTYPRKAYNFLDSVFLNNAICRLLSPVERNLTDLSFSFTHFTVYDDGFPNVCEQSSNLETLTITMSSQGLDETLPTILITCASRTDIHQPREIVVKCNFEGSVCPMRLCLNDPPTGAGRCTLRTNIPLADSINDKTTGRASCVRPLVVPVIDHIA